MTPFDRYTRRSRARPCFIQKDARWSEHEEHAAVRHFSETSTRRTCARNGLLGHDLLGPKPKLDRGKVGWAIRGFPNVAGALDRRSELLQLTHQNRQNEQAVTSEVSWLQLGESRRKFQPCRCVLTTCGRKWRDWWTTRPCVGRTDWRLPCQACKISWTISPAERESRSGQRDRPLTHAAALPPDPCWPRGRPGTSRRQLRPTLKSRRQSSATKT